MSTQITHKTIVKDENILVPSNNVINFIGSGVTVSNTNNEATVNIPGSSNGLFVQTTNSTPITGTTQELSLLGTGLGTLSVPSNTFNVGDTFVAKLSGHITCINTATIHIRVESNSNLVPLGDTGIISLSTTTDKHWELEVYFTIRSLGVSGNASIVSSGLFSYIRNAGTNLEGANFITTNNTSFDTTILNTLKITAQWNTANAGNSIYSNIFVLNKLY